MGAEGETKTSITHPPRLLAASLASVPLRGCPGEGLSPPHPFHTEDSCCCPTTHLPELAGQPPAPRKGAQEPVCRLGRGTGVLGQGSLGGTKLGQVPVRSPGPGTGSCGCPRVWVCFFLALIGKMKSESWTKPGAASFRCLGPKPPQLPKISGWGSETHDVGGLTPQVSALVSHSHVRFGGPLPYDFLCWQYGHHP